MALQKDVYDWPQNRKIDQITAFSFPAPPSITCHKFFRKAWDGQKRPECRTNVEVANGCSSPDAPIGVGSAECLSFGLLRETSIALDGGYGLIYGLLYSLRLSQGESLSPLQAIVLERSIMVLAWELALYCPRVQLHFTLT